MSSAQLKTQLHCPIVLKVSCTTLVSSFMFDNTSKCLGNPGRCWTGRRSNDGRRGVMMMVKRVQTLESVKRLVMLLGAVVISIGRRYVLETVPVGWNFVTLWMVAVAARVVLRLLLPVNWPRITAVRRGRCSYSNVRIAGIAVTWCSGQRKTCCWGRWHGVRAFCTWKIEKKNGKC